MTRMIRFIALLALALPLQSIASDAPKSGFRAEFLRDLDAVQRKIVDLAATVPADKATAADLAAELVLTQAVEDVCGGAKP